jgi:tRNA-dihydrouridine synthase C
MEGLADRPMRLALARLQRRATSRLIPTAADPRSEDDGDGGAAAAARRALLLPDVASSSPGFDEACQEFIRVPGTLPPGGRAEAVARGVCKAYRHDELGATPLAAQLMGSDNHLLSAAARRLAEHRNALHISLNCGCPANQVTGNGAGSSLLKDPKSLSALVASMSEALTQGVSAAAPPPPLLSVKVRAGFDDPSLFGDNVLAARDGGAGMLVVHPRTKAQAYRGRADWTLVDRARQLLEEGPNGGSNNSAYDVPVVGNGDVVRASDALALALSTGCSGLMIGRGAIQDPLVFLRARAAFGALVHLRDSGGFAVDDKDEALLFEGNGGDGDAVRANSRLLREACVAAERALRFSPGDDDGNGGGEAALVESFLRDYVALADAETRARRGGGRGSAARGGGGGGVAGCGGGGFDESDEEAADTHNPSNNNERGRLGRLKSVLKYLFTGRPRLRAALEPLLRVSPSPGASDAVLERACLAVREHWRDGGVDEATPMVDHFSSSPASRSSVMVVGGA